jgi:hypothetical protein
MGWGVCRRGSVVGMEGRQQWRCDNLTIADFDSIGLWMYVPGLASARV